MNVRLPLHRDLAARLEKTHDGAVQRLIALAELPRLGREHTRDADGYGHGSSGDGGSRGSDPTSTTERAALEGDDTATAMLAIAIDHYDQAMRHVYAAASALNAYRNPKQRTEGRVSTVEPCRACAQLALPRAKAGYCEACYRAWDRAGRPDRATFEHERKRREDVA